MQTGNDIILQCSRLWLNFGGLTALADITFDIKAGEILSIIGPNGAGKTSLLNCISGFYRPQQGEITYKGKNITAMPSYKRAAIGIARTFQNIQLYTGLTARANLMAARHTKYNPSAFWGAIFFGRERSKEIKQCTIVEKVIDLLEMESIREATVGGLSYGQRKLVDLGRALALEPDLLLLDEPMAGLNMEEKEDMARFILDVAETSNPSIVMIEHDMGVVMDISERIIVIDFGKIIAQGPPEEIGANDKVIKAYLGDNI